jgi:hypothetical protein
VVGAEEAAAVVTVREEEEFQQCLTPLSGESQVKPLATCSTTVSELTGTDNGGGLTAMGGEPRHRWSPLLLLLALRVEAVQLTFEKARELEKT